MEDIIDLYFRDVATANTALPLKLLVKICKSFRGRGIEFLDLIQEANIAVLKRLHEFDETKGKFTTFCAKVARTALWHVVRERSTIIRIPEKTVPYVFIPIILVSKKLKSAQVDDSNDINKQDIVELRAALGQLPTLERKIIKRIIAGRQIKEVAKELGCATASVRYWERKGLKILFEELGGEYDGRKTMLQMGIVKQKHKNNPNAVYITAFGEKKTLSEWARETGLSPIAITHRLKKGWTSEETISIPSRRGRIRR